MTPDIQPHAHSRRGALLLVVLSMLILFLMLGTVLVTHATRSRTAAASFATAVSASSNPARIANEVLDEALMQLIRGKPEPNTSDFNDESLLADKYSALPAKTGTATIMSANLLVTVTFTPDDGAWNIDDDGDGATDRSATYLDAGGRILTFLPTPDQVGTRSSYRILRAEPANASDPTSLPFTFYLENNPPEISAVLPATNTPVDVVVNNREFPSAMAFAEPYDSFQQDKWLTQFTLSGTSATQPIIIERTAFQKAAATVLEVDNDGDGVLDSEWRDDAWKNTIFPNRTLPNGDTLEFQVSYLVHDLDSRFNVNAHGSLDYAKKAPNSWTTPSDWGTIPQEITDEQIEPGFGWGVADIHLPFTTDADNRALTQRLAAGMANASHTSETPAFLRETRLPSLDGRYGKGAAVTPNMSSMGAGYDEVQDRYAYNNNKLVDLKALMMVFIDPSRNPPELNYRVPLGYVSNTNLTADPYKLCLLGRAPRINSYGTGADTNANNLYSSSELERVLRQYDSDATTLPQRLASLLGNQATDLRMLVTSDSWDTPAMTGGVYKRISGAFRSLNLAPSLLYELLSPDVAAGLRFDINRPFDIADETRSKLDYCRHLYCLLMALEVGDLNQSLDQSRCKRIAQWVVNTVDYRDDDSQSTQFRFDTDLRDGWGDAADMTGLGEGQGWNATSNVVQGNEKTYLAVAETFAWYEVPNHADNSGLFVSLYRPAEETITFPGSSIAPIPTGQLDDSLKGPNHELDICKKNSNGDPVWRLRYTDSDSNDFFVRFDLVTSALKAPFNDLNTSYRDASTLDKDGNLQTLTSLEFAADGFICVYPAQDVLKVTLAENHAAPNVFKTLAVDKGKKMGFLGANSSGNYGVHLERLANPSADWDGSNNPYITINSFDVKPVPKNGDGKQSNGKSYRRCQYHFWKTPGKFENQFEGNLGPLPRDGRGFLSWPNRPFISQAELALVPPGTPSEILDGDTMLAIGDSPYHYLGGDNNESLFTHPEWVLQATHVPSRFRGTAQSFDNTNALVIPELRKLGMELIPYRQLSRFREPGRINLNTLPMADYGSNALARAVIGNIKSQTVFPLEETTDSPPLMRLNNPFSPAGWAKTVSLRSGSALTDSSSLLGLGNEGLYFDSVEASVGNGGGNGGGNNSCNGNCGPNDAPTDQRDYFPLLGLRTAIRLGNVATIRSNVFAVWITARVKNTTTGVETTRRLFAIVDRSIPVAFSPGEDLNSRDIIRVKRYLE